MGPHYLYAAAWISILAFLAIVLPRVHKPSHKPQVDGPNWRQAMLDHGCDKRVARKFTLRTYLRLVD